MLTRRPKALLASQLYWSPSKAMPCQLTSILQIYGNHKKRKGRFQHVLNRQLPIPIQTSEKTTQQNISGFKKKNRKFKKKQPTAFSMFQPHLFQHPTSSTYSTSARAAATFCALFPKIRTTRWASPCEPLSSGSRMRMVTLEHDWTEATQFRNQVKVDHEEIHWCWSK